MLLAATIILIAAALIFTLGVRERDLPAPAPASPFQHLDERKAQIYENLRDLTFEYRVGKLSDDDYAKTKTELHRELARVMSEIDQVKARLGVAVAAPNKPKPQPQPQLNTCPHCGTKFDRALKFCGECGKPMSGDAS